MTAKLAAVLLLSTAACLSSGSDDLGLDDLSSYDQDTGGGKGDDPNCSDATYRTFVQGFMAGTAKAEENPCKWGNDASYRIWAYVAGEQLRPMFEAYGDAQSKRFHNQVTRDQVVKAGTLTMQVKDRITALATIRPAHAGKVGIGAWEEFLYKPALSVATRPVGTDQLTPEAREQWTNEVTAFEDEWLAYVEHAMPQVTEANGWAIWWQLVGATYAGANDQAANTIADQAAVNKKLVDRLAATKPAGAFDEDMTVFQSEFTAKIADDYRAGRTYTNRWYGTSAIKPTGGGLSSYRAWASTFAAVAVDYNAKAHSFEEKVLVNTIINSRPCASGPDVDMIVQRLQTGLAQAGNSPESGPFSALAKPVACTN